MSQTAKAAAVLAFCASTAFAATFTVNTTSDDVDANLGDSKCETVAGGGDCSLRAAVQQANATDGADEIVLPDGVFSLITLGSDEDEAVTGDLDITESVNIRGAGADKTLINGGRLDRVFDVDPARAGGVIVEMRGLTLQDGSSDFGGGIQNAGTLTLNGVSVSDNNATADGGGIFSRRGMTLTLVDSLISGNAASSDGAGILCEGPISLTNCTVSGNTASGSAGGIDNRGPLMMRFSTITGNGAASGAGGVLSRTSAVNTSVGSSIIAANTPANCSQGLTTAGNNIEATSTCGFTSGTDRRNTDPELCPLDDYGGPTHTHALPATSVARDTGAAANCPATDERGAPRPRDGDGTGGASCDVGAFEAQEVGGGCEPITPTPTMPLVTPTPTPQSPTATVSTPTPTGMVGSDCAGDCDGNGKVGVNELVTGVNIALNRADLSACPAFDRDASGAVSVNELVTAVNHALRGCPGA